MKTNDTSLIPSLLAVDKGQRLFGDEIIAIIPAFIAQEHPSHLKAVPTQIEDLSESEQKILYQIAQGLNNKEILEKLHFFEGTVRNYISTILNKLNLWDRTQLAIYYYKHLIDH